MDFYQTPPELKNTFEDDPQLATSLQRILPADIFKIIRPQLFQAGSLAAGQWLSWSQAAQAQEPKHVPYDAWGKRVDEIQLSEGWKKLEAAAAEMGIVACAYEREHGEWSRVLQAALLYLFHPSSAFVSCPLAMTDGAARAIELYGDDDLKKRVFPRLISRDPKNFWTSGQWMTERTGGSDVSGTSTEASPSNDPQFPWKLDGVKWFTSATTSQMAMLLARLPNGEEGSRGLSLFFAELRDSKGQLKKIEILRLKDKLGTRALPTAELRLNGTPAKLVGEEGHGVKKISSLFNITRVYNSICAIGHWRRGLALAWSYAEKREAFGKRLIDHPLHRGMLEAQEKEFSKAINLTFYLAHLLGKDECNTATPEERILLRALTPVCKAYTARKCREGMGEVVEMFGGVGFIEDSGIPALLRDAQVFAIWEGTTNVLALDFRRALVKEGASRVLAKALPDMAQRLLNPKEEDMRGLLMDVGEKYGMQLARSRGLS